MASGANLEEAILEGAFLFRARRGDERAFAMLASIHSDEVYSIARNLSSTDAEATELTQMAFQRAWDQMSSIAAEEAFRVFVCRFVVREAVARLRTAHASARHDPFDAPVQPFFAAGAAAIARLATRRDVAGHLDAAIALLDPPDRAVFVLRIVQGLSTEDAAAILGVDPCVVRRRSHSACLLVSALVSQLAARRDGNHSGVWFH